MSRSILRNGKIKRTSINKKRMLAGGKRKKTSATTRMMPNERMLSAKMY
jgi:hypothetical protein